MNAFEKFLYAFQSTMTKPSILGWYHILCFLLMITASVLVVVFRKKISEKGVKYTILTMSIILIVFEIIKQLIYSFNYDEITQTVTWDYQWYAFPFQFCSTPMYIMLIAGLCKKNLFRDCLYSYLGTFALFAGLVVMFYPGDVFSSTIFINIHTMLWHGSMVVIGVLLWATHSIEFKQKTFLKACGVFLVVLLLAMLMNLIWKWAGGLETGETFNMFYISPFYPCTMPILSIIYDKAHYIVFLLCYVLGFLLAGYIFTLIPILINKINLKIKLKKIQKLNENLKNNN